MTPPMTPREKAEPSLSDLLRQAVETMKSWTPEQREAHFEAQKKAWVAAEMAFGDEGTRVITALASGSGDHAELEVVGWMIEDLILPQQTFTTDDAYARHRAAYRYEGEVTATVEPLVTAASAEARMTELRSAYCAAESDAMTLRKRATQAERQRDELRKALETIGEMAPSTCETSLAHDMAQFAVQALANQGADQ